MSIDVMKQALEALDDVLQLSAEHSEVRAALRAAIEHAERPQTHSEDCWRWHHQCAVARIERMHTQAPTMDDAIAAGDSVIMNEQAALLRECCAALDSLIKQRPTLAGLLCGSTTLGNLKAELGAYRPQGVFGVPRQWQGLTDQEALALWKDRSDGPTNREIISFCRAIEAKLHERNS